MDQLHYTPGLRFWVATTFVISISVFAVVLAGAIPSDKGVYVQYLSLILELAIISGSCVSLLQSSLMPQLSFWAKVQWVGLTHVSTTIGWCIVFAVAVLIAKWFPNYPIFSNKIVTAVSNGLVLGTLIGMTIGLVMVIVQGRIQHLSVREWLVGNLISWSIGISVPLTMFLVILSQATFFF
jgi:predicted membrane-bound spermidine synthase